MKHGGPAHADDWGRAGNGYVRAWDHAFWRLARYATVIGMGAWFAFRIDAGVTKARGDLDSLRVEVRSLAAHSFTREEADRILQEANDEFARNADFHHYTFRPIHMDGARPPLRGR